MSERNVECIRRLFEAFNARDLEAATELMHPDMSWYVLDDQPEVGPFHGRDQCIQWARQWLEAFEGYVVELVELVGVGDCVAMAAHVRGSGRVSGVAVDADAAGVWRLRDGVAVEHRECRTMEEALELASSPSYEQPG